MTSQTGQQIADILPNVSKNEGNQVLKIDQLIKYNRRNTFLQKPNGK